MENVVEKILKDTEKEAAAITIKYKTEAARIENEYKERFLNEKRKIEEEIEELKEKEILRALAKERIFLNKKLTLEIENHINEIIQETVKRLPEKEDYLDFLKGLIKRSNEKEGEIFLSKRDFSRYRAELEDFFKKEGMNFMIKEENNISGGVIIKKEKVTYLGSLDIIVEMLRDELKIEISKMLFPQG